MTLARFCFISSIPMLLVVGNLEAANITMALATDAPMEAKEIGTALTKSQHETILCCSERRVFQADHTSRLISGISLN